MAEAKGDYELAYRFTDPAAYRFRHGDIFLGLDADNNEIGIQTERHLIAVGGSGSGKGAALLVPNARRWPHNLLCIDPKGENAALSWEAREAMGQQVHVIDPFRVADVPDRLRASFNPLAAIDPDSMTVREDLEVIADGLVKIHDPKHMEWVEGARDILAGCMGYVVSDAPPEGRSFANVRALLLQPDSVEGDPTQGLYADAQRMAQSAACGGLVRAAGITIMTALTSEKSMEKDFLGGARRSSKWLDSGPMAAVLGSSSFELASLKTGAASVYLVLPPQYIETHASFLRLFVRCSINAMSAHSSGRGKECLFLLDEFFTLGKIEIIEKAAGLMRSYGVHLWPFLQDLGQLQSIYGDRSADTFFANADAAIFLGNSDQRTLEFVSRKLGVLTPAEVVDQAPRRSSPHVFERSAITPPTGRPLLGGGDPKARTARLGAWINPLASMVETDTYRGKLEAENSRAAEIERLNNAAATSDANAQAEYQHKMNAVGTPRLTPQDVAGTVGKFNGEAVARSMIVFAKGNDVLNIALAPYFQPSPEPIVRQPDPAATHAAHVQQDIPVWEKSNFPGWPTVVGFWVIGLAIIIPCTIWVAGSSGPFATWFLVICATVIWTGLTAKGAGGLKIEISKNAVEIISPCRAIFFKIVDPIV